MKTILSGAAWVLLVFTVGCRTPSNLRWAGQLSVAGEQVNERAISGGIPVSPRELKTMLSMQYPDGEPGLAVPVMELPSLLVDAFQIDLDYHRYPEWVLGALWRKFAANTGFAAAPFGWRGNPDFTACTCWLYVELTMPTIGKSPDDLDFMHDHIVHLFLVRGNRVLAAVKIEPWRGQEADIYKIAERRRATTRAVP